VIKAKKAAIYARVSSQSQKEEETIDSQVDALKLYALENSYSVNERLVFLDNGVSGATLQRPGLDELRDMVKFEPIEAVLIYAPDRLSRTYTHQLILIEEFRKHGVRVCFMKNPPTTNTPEEQMFLHFQGIFAEYERALILDRSRRGRIYKAKKGDPSIIPSLPYGYRKIKREGHASVVIEEEEAKVVKEIFRLYIYESYSLSEVARIITMNGTKPRKGGSSWDSSTIRDILKNHTYLGTSYFGKTERCEGSSKRVRKYGSKVYSKAKYARRQCPQDRWLSISVPQIISESEFEQVQERLKRNKAFASRNTKTPSLLQGLIICGICGQPFYKRIRKNGERSIGYYYCRAQVDKKLKKCSNKALRQEEIDEHVFQEVLKLLKNPTLVQQELERRAKEASSTQEFEQREILLKKELGKLSIESDRLLDAYQSGVVELKELKKRNQSLDVQKRIIEKDIKSIQALKIEAKDGLVFNDLFESVLERMNKKAEKLTFDEKRKLVLLLVEQVIVHKDSLTLIHCVSPRALAREECLLKVGAGK